MAMNNILRIIIDTVFPPTAHTAKLSRTTPDIFLRHYHEQKVGEVTALSHYHVPVIQAAIAAGKFENNRYATRLLSYLLSTWLNKNIVSRKTILIPLPLSRTRQNERGFNQVERVVTHAKAESILMKTNWLTRVVDTTRQTSLDRTERLKNMTGAFTITGAIQQTDWSTISRVVICDDVITTGASLAAAKASLLPHIPSHIELVCLAWAH